MPKKTSRSAIYPGPYKPIEDYGVIGDLYTVALVGVDGCIDFMCFPDFDSPTVFAALLDHDHGGCFRIQPVDDVVGRRQFYLPDTNVLLTRALCPSGVGEISDFMPVEESTVAHNLVRRVKTVRGKIKYRMVCDPRFDYGRTDHTIERDGNDVLFIPKGGEGTTLRLKASCPLSVHDGKAIAECELANGEHASFVLERDGDGDGLPTDTEQYVSEAFKSTVNYWRRWIGQSQYRGRWREMINRSALVLKLLTSAKHGSMVAAPTFGLPERVGGPFNWDYRYTWIRDSSFMIYAFIRLGFEEEPKRFFQWLQRHCTTGGPAQGPLQLMYAIDGRIDLTESTLDRLEGYRGSQPVRIGNAAHGQLQLDIYGELMDSMYLYDKYGEPIHHDLWQEVGKIVDWVAENWNQPDAGIWEFRGETHEFLYSRVMCWVAVDRAVRLARRRSLPAPADRWARVRDELYDSVWEHFWNDDIGAFVQFPGADHVDASALIMPLVRFVSPTDPKWLSTLRAIQRDLVDDSLVYRYRTAENGQHAQEGTFSMCSFWYAECLSRSGDVDQARLYFEKILGHANHLGLYSEELGVYGEHLGNFPQAFTHLALISAAYDIDRRLSNRGDRD